MWTDTFSPFGPHIRDERREAEVEPDVVSETFEVLRSLGHNESEARRLLDTALSLKKKFKDVQSLIEAIYQQSPRSKCDLLAFVRFVRHRRVRVRAQRPCVSSYRL